MVEINLFITTHGSDSYNVSHNAVDKFAMQTYE